MNKHIDQSFDRAIEAALEDVEIPAGLEERLLKMLDAGKVERLAIGGSLPATDSHPEKTHSHPRRSRLLSRRVIALVACAAALLVAVSLVMHSWVRSRQIIEQEQIASALYGWQKALTTSRAEKGLPSDFVLPPLAVKPVKYVPFKTNEGWSAVAVDCTPPSGRPATLFIVRSSARFRVPAAPYTRLAAATGKSVAAWQDGRLLYVLVVEESKNQRLEDFVRRPSLLRSHKRRTAVRST